MNWLELTLGWTSPAFARPVPWAPVKVRPPAPGILRWIFLRGNDFQSYQAAGPITDKYR